MLFTQSAVLTILASLSFASATDLHTKFSFGADRDCKDRAQQDVKNDCSAKGSFLSSLGGKAFCCSDKTRNPPPKDDDCPFNWSWSKKASCCIPPKEVCERDCGEGYVFNKSKMKCERKEVNKCGKGQWWHDRGKECCDYDYGKDKGDCPKGRSCPHGWHWSKKSQKCKPDKPRSPEPDCDDWNEGGGCCGGGHGSSPKPNNPHNDPKPGHGHRRDIVLRRSQIAFPTSEIDELYCPKNLHACSVATEFGSEWSYECLDVAAELESCGGCTSVGEGQDCTKIPHAKSVGCEIGICSVYSCQAGFKPNGTECVPA